VLAEIQKPVRVLVVDDSDVFRNVLRAVVTATPAFEVVGAASSGREALALVDRLVPELVLADVAMPELSGTETARLIRRRHPNVVVVLLSAFSRASVNDRELRVVDKRDLSPAWLADYWRLHGPSR
jgi:DNA-binding NarL/FixJ family response regulator